MGCLDALGQTLFWIVYFVLLIGYFGEHSNPIVTAMVIVMTVFAVVVYGSKEPR